MIEKRIRRPKARIDALVSLLEDEDRHVSTLAMEQLLMHGEADSLVAELQESHNPVLRGRVHQMGSILRMRRERSVFIDKVNAGELTLWEGVQQINAQYDPRYMESQVSVVMNELAEKMPQKITSRRLADFMRNEQFSYPGEDVLGADLYLAEDVVTNRVGAPVLLAVVARELAASRGWRTTVVLHRGKHSLQDRRGNLIEPGRDWKVSPVTRQDKQLHTCSHRDVWLTILCQLCLSSLQEGRLLAIHRVGSILSKLCGGEFQQLPFPLGS